MPNYQVIRVTEEATHINGKAGAAIVVEFKVGDDGPFFERFDKAKYSDTDQRTRLSAFADMLQRGRM